MGNDFFIPEITKNGGIFIMISILPTRSALSHIFFISFLERKKYLRSIFFP